jgi:hypothetical protein
MEWNKQRNQEIFEEIFSDRLHGAENPKQRV